MFRFFDALSDLAAALQRLALAVTSTAQIVEDRLLTVDKDAPKKLTRKGE